MKFSGSLLIDFFFIKACGLVKNLALMTHITTEVDEVPVIRLAFNCGVEDIRLVGGDVMNNPKVFLVFINGNILGATIGYQRLVQVRKFTVSLFF